MKHTETTFNILRCMLLPILVLLSCSSEDDKSSLPEDNEDATSTIEAITELQATATTKVNEIQISWRNPNNKSLRKVELSYQEKGNASRSISAPLQQINVTPNTESKILLRVPSYTEYEISITAINDAGVRSKKVSISAFPCKPEDAEKPGPVFMERADILMTSIIGLYFGKSPRDCWNNEYPNATGPYWDGDALVWGQGAGLSGFVAIREAANNLSDYQSKYSGLTERMFNSINRFITTDKGKNAYAVYPANGNDRFYDDNVWIGLDMADLYIQTSDNKFLDKANMVWDYLMTGNDNTCGGGIHWKELNAPSNTKHTCSTAPTVVLGCKLYTITKEQKYLNKAIELYQWLQTYLQDPSDYLYWDNVRPDMSVDKNKFTYNSGQPMQAACLLYKITGEEKYLKDAQNIAKSAYKKWFVPYTSSVLEESFNILEKGDVWFQAIMFRGFIELYKIDKNRTYITAYEKTMSHAWLSSCRNKNTNLLNEDFRGVDKQYKWEVRQEAACVEMLARLAILEKEGL